MAYGDPNSVFVEVRNTDTSGVGKASLIIQGKDTTGMLVAQDTLDVRSSTTVTLTPGYPLETLPALEAFSDGDVNIRNALTTVGAITAPSVTTNAITLDGIDVGTALADTYSTSMVDALLSEKSNWGDVYERGYLYTQLETNALLAQKQDTLTTANVDESTTHQILTLGNVKILEEGAGINIVSHSDKLVLSATDSGNVYTKAEVDSLLLQKEDEVTGNSSLTVGTLGVGGAITAPSVTTNAITLDGIDVAQNIAARALAVDLLVKANASDVYTRTEVDYRINAIPTPFLSDARISLFSVSVLSTPLTYFTMDAGSGAAAAGLSVALNQTITIAAAGLYFIGHGARGNDGGTYGVTRVVGAGALPSTVMKEDVHDSTSIIRYLPGGTTLTTEQVLPYNDIYSHPAGNNYWEGHFEVVRLF